MKIIVCLDNSDGMLFNNRRQSKDKNVIKDIENLVGDNLLVATPFSWLLFGDKNIKLATTEDFLDVENNDYCFVENRHLNKIKNKITKIIIYRWNRNYPTDFYFDIDYKNNFKLVSLKEFKGNSHDVITREIYEKK